MMITIREIDPKSKNKPQTKSHNILENRHNTFQVSTVVYYLHKGDVYILERPTKALSPVSYLGNQSKLHLTLYL